MKKIGELLLKFLVGILFILGGIPCFLVYFIVAPIYYLIATPIKKSKYKKSNYYKDLGIEFSKDIYESYEYSVYDHIKANSNIKFVKLENHGFLLKNDTTIAAIGNHFDIFHDGSEWKYTVELEEENKELRPFLPYYNEKKATLGVEYKNYKLRLIYSDDDFLNETELEKAKYDGMFLIIDVPEEYETVVL